MNVTFEMSAIIVFQFPTKKSMLFCEVISRQNLDNGQCNSSHLTLSNQMLTHCNKKGKCIHLTAVKYYIIMCLLNINGLFQMPSYRSGAVEAIMTHRMAKDCLWLQIMPFIYSHYSANIQGRRRYVNCPSTSYAKDPIGEYDYSDKYCWS